MMSDNFAQQDVTELLPSVAIDVGKPTRFQTRSVATMNAIKAHILRNNLGPGDPLPTEAALEAELGVSRSSVREALRKLEALDVVAVRHGSGSFVGEMSLGPLVETLVLRASLSGAGNKKFLREVAETRLALDQGVAEEVVAAHAGTDGGELPALVEQMIKAAKENGSFMAEDMAFHRAMLSKIDNQLIKQAYSSFWLVHTSIVPNLESVIAGSAVRTAYVHRELLDAALAGDLPRYREALRDHYAPLLEVLSSEVDSER